MRGLHYPSWRYHRTLPPKIVQTPDEDQALGAEWSDSPAFPEPEPVADAPDPAGEPEAKGRKKKDAPVPAGE